MLFIDVCLLNLSEWILRIYYGYNPTCTPHRPGAWTHSYYIWPTTPTTSSSIYTKLQGVKHQTGSWPVIGRPFSLPMNQHLKYRTRILLILHNKCWHCTENSWPMHNKTQPTNHHPHHWSAMAKIPTSLQNTSHASTQMQQNPLRKCMAGKEETSIQDGCPSPHTNQQ